MTVSTEKISIRSDGGCTFAEANHEVDAQIQFLQNFPQNIGEEIGGGTEVSTTSMQVTSMDSSKGDSSRLLAEGELFTRSVGGAPVADVTKADPAKVVVTYNGISMQLSESMKLGLVEIRDGVVKAKAQQKAAPAPKAIPPADLGPEWTQARRENPSVDNIFASVISAVSEGKEGPALSAKLEDFNRQLNLGCDHEGQVVNIYNALINKLHGNIARDLTRTDSRITSVEDGAEVLNYLLERMSPAERSQMSVRALHGDKGYLVQLNQLLNRELRKEMDAERSGKKKK